MTRELPPQKPRVETGPARFEGDWTGLFIRGDDCHGFAMDLSVLLAHPAMVSVLASGSARLAALRLERLFELMRQTHESRHDSDE